eukprot:gb/GEZN01007976.1/.p1 GENE.gb/GEZN01007976.1/~~gb/GEZN01007976.1/.p1  ORF type:complete len:354 (+),score=36.63 gb/GEZN01007976.1/:241-1302(+)
MDCTFRKAHGLLAILIGPWLLFLVATGMSWSIARYWFLVPKDDIKFLLNLHQMSVAGLERGFPLVIGAALLLMIGSGWPMTRPCFPRGCCGACAFLSSSQSNVCSSELSSVSVGLTQGGAQDQQSSDRLEDVLLAHLGEPPVLVYPPKKQDCSSRRVHNALARVLSLWLLWTVCTACVWVLLFRWLHQPKQQVKWLLRLHSGAALGIPATYCFLLGISCLSLAGTGLVNLNWSVVKEWCRQLCKPTIKRRTLLDLDHSPKKIRPPPPPEEELHLSQMVSPLVRLMTPLMSRAFNGQTGFSESKTTSPARQYPERSLSFTRSKSMRQSSSSADHSPVDLYQPLLTNPEHKTFAS